MASIINERLEGINVARDEVETFLLGEQCRK